MKKVTIEINEDAASDIADVLCWLRGFIEAKGPGWESYWLKDSLNTISNINQQIKNQP